MKFVVYVISSSVVLSFGMVGALSIVRFRTAIKDPIDLMFLFWAISVGIICGAGLAQVTVILSLVLTLGVFTLDQVPVLRAQMVFVVNACDGDAEERITQVVTQYDRHACVKSRNMPENTLDLVIELRTARGNELIREVMKLAGIISDSLIAHDGEVTF